MDIVFIGDSLTFGYGVPKENSWVSLLVKSYTSNYVNKGINGDTTVGILSRFFKDVVSIKPKYCFILCGTNDLLLGKNLDYIYDNILLMVKDCIINEITSIVISPPYISENDAMLKWSSYPNYEDVNNNLLNLNNKLKNYCNINDFLFIDLFNPTKTSYFNNEPIYLDGVHFNSIGHKLIYTEINDIFKNIAKRSVN